VQLAKYLQDAYFADASEPAFFRAEVAATCSRPEAKHNGPVHHKVPSEGVHFVIVVFIATFIVVWLRGGQLCGGGLSVGSDRTQVDQGG